VAVLALLVSPLMALNVVGTVKTINADQNQLVLTDQNGRDWTIQVGQNAQIMTNNNNQARLSDLRQGQVVNVAYDLQNNQLVARGINAQQATQAAQQGQQGQQGQRLQTQQGQQQQQQGQLANEQQGQGRAQQGQHTTRGKIERVNADQHQFTLKDENGREMSFHCGRNARVDVNGREAKLADLQQGQEVTVNYRQELTDIRAGEKSAPAAQQEQGQTVQGQIQQVQAAQHQISLRDQNGRERTFQVGQNAQVQVNGRNGTLADLQQGQQVTATQQMVANDIRTGGQNQNR
jgi:phosphotransferase system IIA component